MNQYDRDFTSNYGFLPYPFWLVTLLYEKSKISWKCTVKFTVASFIAIQLETVGFYQELTVKNTIIFNSVVFW